jgi:hypothetical protein
LWTPQLELHVIAKPCVCEYDAVCFVDPVSNFTLRNWFERTKQPASSFLRALTSSLALCAFDQVCACCLDLSCAETTQLPYFSSLSDGGEMVPTLPAQQVLSNPDLLDLIFEQLDKPSIAIARLVNRNFEQRASPYLFRTLVITARTRHLRRLERVAESDKFSKGVREIVWDTAPYGDGSTSDTIGDVKQLFINRSALFCLTGEDPTNNVELYGAQARKVVARMWQLEHDEAAVFSDSDTLRELLVWSFQQMPGLKSVVITSWYMGENGERRRLDV